MYPSLPFPLPLPFQGVESRVAFPFPLGSGLVVACEVAFASALATLVLRLAVRRGRAFAREVAKHIAIVTPRPAFASTVLALAIPLAFALSSC